MTTERQVERLLRLAPYLQAHPDVSVEQVAASLGVPPRQVVADLQVLMMCGTGPYGGQLIDVDLDRLESSGRIRISNAEVLATPMRFTPAEVVPLVVGLRVLREVAGPAQRDAVDRAIAKLHEAAGSHADAATRVEVATATASEEIRRALDEARQRGVRLSLTYAGGTTTRRVVDVDRLVLRDGITYLRAWSAAPEGHDAAAAGWRTFRLDRIVAAEPTTDPVGDHPDPPADDWPDALARGEMVEIEVDPRGTWIQEVYPVEARGERPDGRPGARVRLRVVNPDWFVALMLRLGDSARVIGPDAAAIAVRQAAEAALRGHGATPASSAGAPASSAGAPAAER